MADDIKTLQYEIQYLKRKLQEYNVRLDDYVPPDDINPIVLKLDKNGNEIDIDIAMDKINARIKEIEQLHSQEAAPAAAGSNKTPKNDTKVLLEPKVLRDPKDPEPSSLTKK